MIELLKKLYRLCRLFLKVSIIKTFYFNFKMFPFAIAIKFPFLFYGKIKFGSLNGCVVFNCPVKTGIVQIGKMLDGLPGSTLPVIITINNKLIINGPVIIAGGNSLTIWEGTLDIGQYCTIGSGVTIRCSDSIRIGDYTRIVGGCTLMDTNVHYTRNTVSGIIQRLNKPIVIGKYCWVNMGTVLAKGTVLPDYCIVARNSFLSKDYSITCSPASLLAGSPAVVKFENVQRIFSIEEENRLTKYFLDNPSINECISENGIVEDGFGVNELFKIF